MFAAQSSSWAVAVSATPIIVGAHKQIERNVKVQFDTAELAYEGRERLE